MVYFLSEVGKEIARHLSVLVWERIWALLLRIKGYLGSYVQEIVYQESEFPSRLQHLYQIYFFLSFILTDICTDK
jgi:hypothetical protein